MLASDVDLTIVCTEAAFNGWVISVLNTSDRPTVRGGCDRDIGSIYSPVNLVARVEIVIVSKLYKVARRVVPIIVGGAGCSSRSNIPKIAFYRCDTSAIALTKKNRNSDGGQYPDDDHDDQKLDQGEAPLVPFHLLYVPQPLAEPLKHVCSLLCCWMLLLLLSPLFRTPDTFFGRFSGNFSGFGEIFGEGVAGPGSAGCRMAARGSAP